MHPRFILADAFAALCGMVALAAWQDQLDWSLRIIASLVAIVTGGIAIRQYHKRKSHKVHSG